MQAKEHSTARNEQTSREAFQRRQCRWRCFALLLLLAGTGATVADDGFRPHPACFEPFAVPVESGNHPATLNLDACSEQHADKPVSRFLGQTRYERPRGAAGDLRGSLAYERISGRNDRVMYRLIDNAGGTGVFSLLVTGREVDTTDGPMLQNIEVRELGDRCHLGTAWVGNDADNDVVVGVSLTPAALPRVLAAPDYDMPHAERDQQRGRQAFGDHLERALTTCPSCCVGEAIYTLASDGGCWQLVDVTLDSLEPFDHTETATLHRLLREATEETPEGYALAAESIAPIQRALISAHPDPSNTRRAQFWLRQLGYYWLARVDGVAGPRTEAAIRAWREHSGKPNAVETPMLDSQEANELAEQGLHYDGMRLHPRDETKRDPGFAAFIDRLKRAVRERDSEALVSMTAPDIMLGFGGSGGHRDLRSWLGHPEIGPDIWQQLENILPLGAVREGPNAYCLPYTGCLPTRLLAGLDPFATVIVTATDATLLAAPDDGAIVIRALDYDILTLIDSSSAHNDDYHQVRDIHGNEGFVSRQAIAFAIGPRMEIIRHESGWRIQSLVSGD